MRILAIIILSVRPSVCHGPSLGCSTDLKSEFSLKLLEMEQDNLRMKFS